MRGYPWQPATLWGRMTPYLRFTKYSATLWLGPLQLAISLFCGLLGAFLVNITTTGSIRTSMGIAVGNTLEALVAAYLVTKFADGTDAFYKPWNVLRFVVLAGMVPTALCATSGVSLLCRAGFASWSDFWRVWSVWWAGDMLGAILLTPFLVLLLGHKRHSLGVAELGEASILLVGLSIVCVLNFGLQLFGSIPKAGLLYWCAPFMAWVALFLPPRSGRGNPRAKRFCNLGFFAWIRSLWEYGRPSTFWRRLCCGSEHSDNGDCSNTGRAKEILGGWMEAVAASFTSATRVEATGWCHTAL
jgi:MASE1